VSDENIGTVYKSDDKPSLEAQYTPHPNATEATDPIGHFQIPKSDIKVTLSGPLNCLEDSLVAQLRADEKARLNIHTGQDLRDWGLAYLVNHPEYAQQSDIHYQTLRYYDPAALLRGGSHQDIEMVYAWHELHGTEPDWGGMGARDLGFAVGLTSSLGQQAKNAVVGLAGLPTAVIKGLIKLVEDPQGTVEATLAKIKALPGYVKHAPAAFKEHINAIQAIEDPYEQGKAVGELVGQELPVGGAVGKIASKLGRWGKVAKPKKRQERIGSFKSFDNLGELGHLFRNKTLNGVSGDLINGGWKKLEGNWGTRIVFEKRIGKKKILCPMGN
jgi:hypothetical protein